MRVVALAGGTGSAKLLRGLYGLPIELTVVANVGDNVWMHGVYVCPDVDIACYALAGIADRKRGWGIAGDTFRALSGFRRLGLEAWFRLGDQDLAVCLARTDMLRRGETLTAATDVIRNALGVKCPLLPASDEPVATKISSKSGELSLQEFWVRDRGRPQVMGVRYDGASRASPTPDVVSSIRKADLVVLCPANPVTSIGPMLAMKAFERLLADCKARVVALSPMSGAAPISGPAGKLLKATGHRADSVGVCELYSGFLDAMMISRDDRALLPKIRGLGISCAFSDTLMRGPRDEVRLARELLKI